MSIGLIGVMTTAIGTLLYIRGMTEIRKRAFRHKKCIILKGRHSSNSYYFIALACKSSVRNK